eukprot:6477575-Amphidinium_carterae.1
MGPRRTVPLPAGLKGSSTTPDGSAICFSYNLDKCPVQGVGCGRGKHVCTLCFKQHPFSKCADA